LLTREDRGHVNSPLVVSTVERSKIAGYGQSVGLLIDLDHRITNASRSVRTLPYGRHKVISERRATPASHSPRRRRHSRDLPSDGTRCKSMASRLQPLLDKTKTCPSTAESVATEMADWRSWQPRPYTDRPGRYTSPRTTPLRRELAGSP